MHSAEQNYYRTKRKSYANLRINLHERLNYGERRCSINPSPSINCNFPLAIPRLHQSTRKRSQLSDDKDTRPLWSCNFLSRRIENCRRSSCWCDKHTRTRGAQLVIETLAASYGYLRASLIRYLMLVARERHRFIPEAFSQRDKKSPRIILAFMRRANWIIVERTGNVGQF